MRALLAVVVSALAACGGGTAGPEEVVREWSEALNAGDYGRAASLFAEGAEVVQGARVFVFATPADAVDWNAALPCRGRIIRAEAEGDSVQASFLLSDRPDRPCDAPGAVARVRVRDGKIVLFHQLEEAREAPAVA